MRITDREVSIALRFAFVGVVLVGGAVLGGILLALHVEPVDLDVWWNGFVAVLAPVLNPFAMGMDFVGGGWFATFVVPLGGAAVLLLMRRPWAAGLFVAASLASALAVQVLKNIFGRARPEEILVPSDFGSYPSGHVANAATVGALLVIIAARWWAVWVAGAWVFLMAFSRTQVHAHWVTDTVGGALVGVGAALLVGAAFVLPMYRELYRNANRREARRDAGASDAGDPDAGDRDAGDREAVAR